MKRTAKRLGALGVGLTAISVGCSSTHVVPPEEATPAQATNRIVGGQADATHPAVVSINESCSGTIIRVDPQAGIGWILTAAHCFPGTPSAYVLQGTDLRGAGVLYFTADYVYKDPRYNTTASPYDLALVRIVGVDASTPVLPLIAANEDTLAGGSAITVVGYGQTVVAAADAGAGASTIRKSIARTISQLSATHIVHSNSGGGACYGDSGGAVVAAVGGGERLVGVNSYVSATGGATDCGPNNSSYAVRVTTAVRDWVTQTIAQTSASPASCESCRGVQTSGKQTCADEWRTCLLDTDCAVYRTCALGCSTYTCLDACARSRPRGYGFSTALETCLCFTGCQASCTSSCLTLPKCGITPETVGSCASCTESKCCAELLDCASDGTCSLCQTAPADAGAPDAGRGDASTNLPLCASHPKRAAITACTRSKCQAECHPTQAAPTPESGEDSATTTAETPASASAPEAAPESSDGGCATSTRPSSRAASGIAVVALFFIARRRRARPPEI